MKTVSVFSICVLILVLFSAFTCVGDDSDIRHYHIPFTNFSSVAIVVCHNYADTTLKGHDIERRFIGTRRVFPAETNPETLLSFNPWECVFSSDNGNRNPLKVLAVFVLDANKLEADVEAEDALLVRYDLCLSDLQRLNWRLSYPPNTQMREIKMFPPYEEVIANAKGRY